MDFYLTFSIDETLRYKCTLVFVLHKYILRLLLVKIFIHHRGIQEMNGILNNNYFSPALPSNEN